MAGAATGREGQSPIVGEYWTPAGTIRGPLARQETAALMEREQVAIADPVPLGLAGFASATFTISAVLAGWFSLQSVVVAIPVALIFGGIGQFLAGMWAFRRGNVLAATAFGSFGAFNMSWAVLQWMMLAHLVPGAASGGNPAYVMGIFILTFCLIALYLGVAALAENTLIAAVLFILALAYLCDGIGVMIGGENIILGIGGYAGMVTSLLAFYASFAYVVNSAIGREALPVFTVRRTRVVAE
jgi:succinate-acetate transporter protein